MPRYHIHFRAIHERGASSEHTRIVECECPIEYDSDIEAVQLWAAKEVHAGSAMLISWRELKGINRPSY